MRRLRLLLLPALAATLTAALTATLIARAGSPGADAFRTPDAAAACRLAGSALVCSSLGSRGSVALGESSRLRVVHVLPWWDAATQVLRRWQHDSTTCRLAGGAILCHDGKTSIRVDADGFGILR
jgi:hypothetical protein